MLFHPAFVCLFALGTMWLHAVAEQKSPCPMGEAELLQRDGYHLSNYVPPKYPPLALQAQIQGFVRVAVNVDKSTGRIKNSKLISGHPLLLQAAVASVRELVFDPALLNDDHLNLMFDFYFPCFPRRSPPAASNRPRPISIGESKSPCRYTIEQFKNEDWSVDAENRIEIKDDAGTLVQRIVPPDGGRTDRIEVRDLDSDGIPELIVGTSTGGAHCCTVTHILSLDCGLTERLVLKGGNADYPTIVSVTETGEQQLLVDDCDTFAYFPHSFADSPVIPMVLCLENGKYSDCTSRFPGLLLKRLGGVRDDLSKTEDAYKRDGLAVTLLGIYMLLREENAGWQDLSRLLDKRELAWLNGEADMIRRKLVARAQRMITAEH